MRTYKARIYRNDITYTDYFMDPLLKTTRTAVSGEIWTYEFTVHSDTLIDFGVKEQHGLVPIVIIDSETDAIVWNTYLAKKKKNFTSYGSNPTYIYTLQCVSPLYKLQRITVPNKTITQKMLGEPRTIYEELERIKSCYGATIELHPSLENILDIPCPEMNFTKSNLFEIVTSLFEVARVVPHMTDYSSLTAISKNPDDTNTDWTLSYFDDYEEEQDLTLYSDGLDIDVENAIGLDNIVQTGWIKATADGNQMVTVKNFVWELPHNIYEIKKLEIRAILEDREHQDEQIREFDITDYVCEEEVYNTLKQSTSTLVLDNTYKRGNLYYKRGDNKIQGGGYDESEWVFGISSVLAIQNIVNNFQTTLGLPDANVRKVLLRATYLTEADNTRIIVGRNDTEQVTNRMVSNQNDSYIDSVNFGKLQQENVERIGNEIISATKKITNLEFKPNLKDIIIDGNEKYIITKETCVYKDSCVDCLYEVGKYRAFTTGYAALKQEKRFTSIDTHNTTIRNDVDLHTYRITLNNSGTSSPLAKLFVGSLGEEIKLSMHTAKTYFEEGGTSQLLLLTSQNTVIGKSVCCTIKMQDNVSAGRQIENSGLSAYAQKNVIYTDTNGEFQSVRIYFGGGEIFRNINTYDLVKAEPVVTSGESSDYLTINKTLYKDNREITHITIQFRFISGEQNVFFYDKFLELNPLIYKGTGETYKVWRTTSSEQYSDETTEPLGSVVTGATVQLNNDGSIRINGLPTPAAHEQIAITDNQNNLIFAFNEVQNKITTSGSTHVLDFYIKG